MDIFSTSRDLNYGKWHLEIVYALLNGNSWSCWTDTTLRKCLNFLGFPDCQKSRLYSIRWVWSSALSPVSFAVKCIQVLREIDRLNLFFLSFFLSYLPPCFNLYTLIIKIVLYKIMYIKRAPLLRLCFWGSFLVQKLPWRYVNDLRVDNYLEKKSMNEKSQKYVDSSIHRAFRNCPLQGD